MSPVSMDSNRILRRAGLLLSFFLLAVSIGIPLLLIFWQSITPNQRLDWMAPLRTITGQSLSGVLLNSVWLGICVVAGTTLLAMPLAWMMAKTRMGLHRWIDVILLIPFMTPPYIGSMGWILFMQKGGYLQQWLPGAGVLSDSFFSFWGMVFIMSMHLFPFLYLLLRDALIRIGGNLEEAGAVHGAKAGYRFRRIIMPLLLSAYGMGVMLVFVKTIAEFGTPATFGRKIGYYVMTSEIHKYISSWPIDFGKATSLASVLLSVCLVIWYMQSAVSRRFTYRLVGGKGQRSKTYSLRGGAGWLAGLYLASLLLLSIGIPYFSIIAASLMKLRGAGLSLDNLTLDHYRELLSWGSVSLKAIGNSLGLSLAAASVAVILGAGLALAIGRSSTRLQRIIDLLSLLPNTVPGIVMVVGLILLWNAPWMPFTLYNTYGMVVLTYVVLFLPYTVQYVKASFSQINGLLFQAAQVSGAGPFYILRRILLPLIMPGMLAGWMMTFTISVRELVGSLLILPPSMQTSATYIFAQFEQGQVSLGMAMAVVSVGLTVLLLLGIELLNSRRKWNGS
ncbi:iron ABC transporter permease [Paenibacillus sp. FSL H7-0756]|uniref:ABC transporter permease n=1 Tax=unclassified Paenibacillus TaxID=185978 RepID=UPI0030F62EBD